MDKMDFLAYKLLIKHQWYGLAIQSVCLVQQDDYFIIQNIILLYILCWWSQLCF